MPSGDIVARFTAQVLSGDYAGAISDRNTENAAMQENQAQPRRARDLLIAHEQATLETFFDDSAQMKA